MQLCSTPARTHNAWRRPAQQRSEHPPRLLYQRWNNRSHCSQVARWVEHIALRPVATDPAAGQCRPPQDERPPRALLEVGPRLWAGARSAATEIAPGVTSCRLSQVLQFSFRYRIAGGVVDVRDEQPPPAVQTSRAAGQEEVCRPSSGILSPRTELTGAGFSTSRGRGGLSTRPSYLRSKTPAPRSFCCTPVKTQNSTDAQPLAGTRPL